MPSEQESDTPCTVPAGEMIDRLCDEFEENWRADPPLRLEDVLRRAPEAMRPALFRELLAIEKALRERDRRPLTTAEARTRFAALGAWTESVIAEVLAETGTWPEQTPSDQPYLLSETRVPSTPGLPAFVGGYRILRELGRGGMGVVYLVDDPRGCRPLAVKMMLTDKAADSTARDRFLREARAACQVKHDNVVDIYQVGEDGGAPYLVMPFLEGESLEERLKRDPLPPLPLVLKIGREIALGLAAAHQKGLVHRDVKPSNTWLEGTPTAPTLDAQVRRVKVLDFGLARAVDRAAGVTITGQVLGTPAYMAPEQARGENVDGRADLFSLGAVLYRMATGQPAFAGPTLTAILTAIATHNPPPAMSVNAAIPLALSKLIDRLLEKDPARRLQSAAEVVQILAAIEQGQSPRIGPPPRRRWAILGGVLLALCVGTVAARSLFPGPQSAGVSPTNKEIESPPIKSDPPPPPPTDVFRVKSIHVKHYQTSPKGDTFKGILGQKSFSPVLGDRAQVVATLSRPGYAYVIVFRPDGVAELCFPNDEDTAPPRTDTPRYPAVDNGKAYGLREGTGLWAFVVVASETPLPTYREWLAGKKPNWKPTPAPGGLTWWYDGAVVEECSAGGCIVRGKDEELTGPSAMVRSLGQSLLPSADGVVGVLGFGVGNTLP